MARIEAKNLTVNGVPLDFDTNIDKGWRQHIGNCNSISISFSSTFKIISFDEEWFLAYQARMYAEYFKN